MWVFIIIVIAVAVVYFVITSSNESAYIESHPFDVKFKTFIDGINKKIMRDNGELHKVDNREYWITTYRLKIQFIYRRNSIIVIRVQDDIGFAQNISYTFSNTQNVSKNDQLIMVEEFLHFHIINP